MALTLVQTRTKVDNQTSTMKLQSRVCNKKHLKISDNFQLQQFLVRFSVYLCEQRLFDSRIKAIWLND